MATYLEQNLGVREELQQKLEGILAQDPTLERDLIEYHSFHEKADVALQSIPSYYRGLFERAIQQQVLRLKAALDLEEKLNLLPNRSDEIVPVIFTIDKDHSQMFWALPAAIRIEEQDNDFSQRMDGLENAFIQCLSLLAHDPDWTLLDIERVVWAGFRSLTTLVEYSGKIPIRDAVQEFLAQRFIETWPFNGLIPNPQVAELAWDTWLLGQPRSGAVLNLKAVFPEETLLLTEPMPQPVETVLRFFNEKDITAWERPLRVTENSNWTVSARRLRTLLVRLASQGRVGKDGISSEYVMSGLSKEHLASFENLVPVLIENGVLRQEAIEGNTVFSLNPDHLEDVQDLINRDMTPFWVPLRSVVQNTTE